MTAPRVVLVTGASSGIGRLTADLLHRRGWVVWGASRSIETLTPKPAFRCVTLDVSDETNVAEVFERITRESGGLDAVINCAGWVLTGAVEETTLADARRQFETNYFGALAVCRLAASHLRARGHGVIVNVASVAGHIPMAFQAHYSASKAALIMLTRALRLELAPFNVQVVSIEPGDFATGITAARQLSVPVARSVYPAFARTLAVITRDETSAAPADEVAERIARVLDQRRPPASILVGQFIQRYAVLLRAVLPARVFDWALTKLYAL